MNSQPAPVRSLLGLILVCAGLPGLANPLPGDPDPGFRLDPALSSAPEVLAAAAHPDGRLLAVFAFAAGPELVALNADGSLDAGFVRRPLPGFWPRQLTVLGDGRILTAYQPAGAPTNTSRIVRLSVRSELDPAFAVEVAAPGVSCLAPMPDGALMVGALIPNGTASDLDDYLHRVLPDGTFDPGFAQSGNFTRAGSVRTVISQGDGYVVLGGGGLYRLNRSGQRDESFQPPFDLADAVVLLPDGKFLVSGWPLNPPGRNSRWLLRLNADATVDNGFPPIAVRGAADRLAVRSDGTSLVGGAFDRFGRLDRSGLALLLSDGRVEAGFAPRLGMDLPDGLGTVDLMVHGLGELADGRTFVAGHFTQVDGAAMNAPLAVFARVSVPAVPIIAGLPARREITEGHTLDLIPRLNVAPESTFEWHRGAVLLGTLPELHLRNVQLRDAGPVRLTVSAPGGSVSGTTVVEVVGGPSHPGSVDVRFGSMEELPIPLSVPRLDGLGVGQRAPAAIAATAEGEVLLGGAFADFGGPRSTFLARLNGDGSVDPAFQFNPVLAPSARVIQVIAVRALPGGKALAAAQTTRSPIVNPAPPIADAGAVFRLLPDGTPDTSFGTGGRVTLGRNVWAMDLDSAGRIVVLHRPQFGEPTVLRLLADGQSDLTFKAPAFSSANLASLRHLALQPDGSLIIGGTFETVGGQSRQNVARLLAAGSLDPAFVPPTGLLAKVSGLLALGDGRVLVSEPPAVVGTAASFGLVRLLANGAVDASFRPANAVTNGLHRLAHDAAGNILALVSGSPGLADAAGRLVRLRPDGELDPEFRLGLGEAYLAGDTVSFARDPSGQILMAGDLWEPEGLGRHTVVRLNANDERRMVAGRSGEGHAQLRLNSRAGRTYVIEHTPGLDPAQWTEVTRLNGTGALLEWTSGATGTDGFYRARLE